MRVRSGVIAAFVLIFAVAVIALRLKDKEPILLGFCGTLTGYNADLGIAGRDGALLAVEEQSAKGGIRGRDVRLLIRDDGGDPAKAKRMDGDLIGMGAKGVIGHMTSSLSIAGLPAFKGTGSVLVSPTSSTNELTGKDDEFIRLYPPSRTMAAYLASIASGRLHLKRVAILMETSNIGHTQGWADQFALSFKELGGTIPSVTEFDTKVKPDYGNLSESLMSKNPDGVLILADPIDTASICQQLGKFPDKPRILLSEWSTTDDLLGIGGHTIDGAVFLQTFDRECKDKAYRDFRLSYKRRFGHEPTFASVHGYDAARLIMKALESDPEGRNMKADILAQSPFKGIQHAFTLDQSGDPTRKLYPMAIRNGSYGILEYE